MKRPRKLYINDKWYEFSQKVQQRDNFKCLRCSRSQPEVILQVHHEKYINGKAPWEYALSDCLTLCKGCHVQQHNLTEPDRGWSLISIDDLGGLDGTCERNGCGRNIRYEHLAYHAACGYKVVGSTCIEILTQEDQLLSSSIIKSFKNISDFIHGTEWREGLTGKGNKYLEAIYKHHKIRIYGKKGKYAYQLALKEKGTKWYDFRDTKELRCRELEQAQEIAYIVLRGTISEDEEEKSHLREIYTRVVQSHT